MNPATTPRFFVAVPIPASHQVALATWAREMKKKWPFAKWVHQADYHLTLQFLGFATSEQRVGIKESLSRLMQETAPFQLAMKGIGTFGRPDQPRILWIGVTGELERLHQLQSQVVERLSPLGFLPEDRPYRPHITVARKYRQSRFPYDQLADIPLSPEIERPWTVERVVLYQTHMGKIPMYEAVDNYPIGDKKEETL
ncbi:RNA 2',3'-cyclic phosphodiesterase [Laceyella putida]|uniref:RNA 2',3'-cyclic phosphodiesterase n=1 Tax=Laceyella putida TaxID=110101 RepID=A0ABW2RM78_9BACL